MTNSVAKLAAILSIVVDFRSGCHFRVLLDNIRKFLGAYYVYCIKFIKLSPNKFKVLVNVLTFSVLPLLLRLFLIRSKGYSGIIKCIE